MKSKIQVIILLGLICSLVIVLLTPLNYTSFNYLLIHCWIIIIYSLILVANSISENRRILLRKITFSILTIGSLITLYLYIITPNNIKIIPVKNSKYIITYNFYTLFMMGNPRAELSIGESYLNGLLIYESSRIIRDGGESNKEIQKYVLPYKIESGEGIYIFPKECYLLDRQKDTIIKIKRKISTKL